MNKKIIKTLMTLAMLFSIVIASSVSYGEETTTTSTSEDANYQNEEVLFLNQFSYVVSQPKNQKKSVSDRLELLMTENSEQVISVTLINKTESKLVLVPSIYQASTSSNGEIVYEEKATHDLVDAAYQAEAIFQYPEKIEIPEKGSVEFQFSVKMPQEKFDGQLQYGLLLSDENDKFHQLVTPIVLYETDAELQPDVVLKKVSYDEKKGKVHIRLENPSMTVLENADLKYEIQQDAKNQIKGQVNNLYVAPLSTFEISVDADYLDVATNQLQLSLKSQEFDKSWEKSIIDDKDSSKSGNTNENEGIVDFAKQKKIQYILFSLICVALLVALVLAVKCLFAMKSGKGDGEKK